MPARPGRPFLCFLLATVAAGPGGCLAPGAPPPPLVRPLEDGPSEFLWLRPRWEDGDRLVYRTHYLAEVAPGGQEYRKAGGRRAVARVLSLDRNVHGLRRVRLTLEHTDVYDVVVDDEGRLVETTELTAAGTPPLPPVPSIPPMVLFELLWPLPRPERLEQGRPALTRLPASRVPGFDARTLAAPSGLDVQYVFAGYRELDGTRVAEIHVTLTPSFTLHEDLTIVRIGGRAEGKVYVAPESGLTVATHFVFVTESRMFRAEIRPGQPPRAAAEDGPGQMAKTRLATVNVLDRSASRRGAP
ncbi:MAG: hypothetical protein ACREMB_06740 [Candidatus Rokuibacteriota bacterium]